MTSPSRAPPTGTPRHPPSTHMHTRTRPANSGTATPEGSLTTTITSLPTQPNGLVLRLRGAHETQTSETTETGRTRRIQWAEGVIDNEGLGRKKSKVCCIYHKTREFGESSSEEDSGSSSDDDESGDDGAARPVGGYGRGRKGKDKGRKHDHDHGDGDGDGDGDGCNGHGHDHGGGKEKRKPSPNAYERMPRYDVKPLHGRSGT